MKPEQNRSLLTVGEIAALMKPVAPNEVAMAALIERLRHWTKEGLLQSIEMPERGTGRHRRYHPEVVIDAIVLNALADVGLSVATHHRRVQDALAVAHYAIQKWRRTKAMPPFWLVVKHYLGETDSGGWGRVTIETYNGSVPDDPDAAVIMTVNLSRVL